MPKALYLPVLAAISLVGCEEDEIRTYQAPKEQAAARRSPIQKHTTPLAIQWDKPEHWVIHPEPSLTKFAAAVFQLDGEAKISVTPLGGDGGGDLANINRWRRQLGLPTVARLDQQPIKQMQVGASQASIVDLSSPDEANRLIVAILHQPNQTWFVKMNGLNQIVEREKDSFEAFVQSIRFRSE